jgi:hypothetical protein
MYSLFSFALLPRSLLASAEGAQCLQLLQITLDAKFFPFGVLLLQRRVARLGRLVFAL